MVNLRTPEKQRVTRCGLAEHDVGDARRASGQTIETQTLAPVEEMASAEPRGA